MKKYMLFFALVSLLTFAVSCNKGNNSGVNEEEEAALIDALKAKNLLSSLCQIETLEDGTVKYTPLIGQAIESSKPTTYYTVAETEADARQIFYGIIAVMIDVPDSSIEVNEVKQGDVHLKFQGKVSGPETAVITVDCPELKDVLTEIVFLPSASWPTNAGSTPFKYLSVWKYEGRTYVCVKTSENGNGIMLTFDGGWGEEMFTKYSYWQGEFSLWTNTADATTFDYLAEAIKNQGTQYTRMLSNMGDKGLWEEILLRTVTFDNNYSYDHGLWWAHYCYYVTINRTSIFNGAVNHFSNYYEHKNPPTRTNPSSQISFDSNFNTSGWECIYKGV